MGGKQTENFELSSKIRMLSGNWNRFVSFIAVSMSVFHLYTAFFGIFVSILQRSAHIGFALILTFAVIKPIKKKDYHSIKWYDMLLILASIGSFGYLVFTAKDIVTRYAFVEPLTQLQVIVGLIAIVLLVEATRRTVGMALAAILLFFLGYALWGHNISGVLGHREFDIAWVIEQLFYTTSGVFGIPLGVSATFIFIFILFGKFLEHSGAGQFFIDLAVAGMGKYRGGPAKTAVIASSILGTISGSAVANTVTTGAFTIPLMKKTGYKKEFAAGVEAVASSGGQIMPPIMGASAFIIASFLGIPYIEVAIAAAIPALLFYLCLIFQVDFRAMRRGLVGLPKNELPDMKAVLKKGFLFFAPLILIVVMLVMGASPMKAGLTAILTVLAVALVKASTRIGLKKILLILDEGARGALETAVACAAAGMVIGLISLTGLGIKFSGVIIGLAGGSLLLTLIFTMISSIFLGMGLPTVAAYIVQVALTVPALIELGVAPIAAHLFIFYFAIVSAITPPVALAAYAGAGIAGSDPMKTGLTALKLGIGAFIVPYMFIYGPQLLMIGSPMQVIWAVITACIGIYGVAAGAEGWLKRHMSWWERIIIFVSSIVLIIPGLWTDIAGFAGLVLIYLIHRFTPDKYSELAGNVDSSDKTAQL